MGEKFDSFVARVQEMKAGEIIDQGNNLDAMYFLKLSCECFGVATKMELESEDGTPFGKKVLVLYKA